MNPLWNPHSYQIEFDSIRFEIYVTFFFMTCGYFDLELSTIWSGARVLGLGAIGLLFMRSLLRAVLGRLSQNRPTVTET